MKNIMVIVVLILSSTLAQAAYSSSKSWACSLRFDGYAKGIQLIVGFYRYNGLGNINCTSSQGEKVSLPIKVSMQAAPISPTVSLSNMRLVGTAGSISLLNEKPSSILGTYGVLQGSVAFIGGVGAMTAVHSDFPAITLNLTLQLVEGFGINLGINRMVIALDKRRL